MVYKGGKYLLNEGQQLTQAFLESDAGQALLKGVRHVGTGLCNAGELVCKAPMEPVCRAARNMVDTTTCVLNEFTPTMKCQTGHIKVPFGTDERIRYRLSLIHI